MKYLIVLIILIQAQASLAALPDYVVSPRDFIPRPAVNSPVLQLPVFAGKTSYFLEKNSFCFIPGAPPLPPAAREVLVNENNIKVLFRLPPALSSVECTPPPPPSYYKLTEIPGLATGTYDLSYYVIPNNVPYPPSDSDLPNYLNHELSFNVLAVESVDTLSNWSIGILLFLLLIIAQIFHKRVGFRDKFS